jgi:hypothetical protein
MKLPERFYIIIHSDAHSKLIQDKLSELGYRWPYTDRKYCNTTIGPKPNYKYGELSIAADEYELSYSPNGFYSAIKSYTQIFTDDLLSIKVIKTTTVKLNDNHDAVVSSDGTIKVGCQTFSHEIVKSLAQAIEEVTK